MTCHCRSLQEHADRAASYAADNVRDAENRAKGLVQEQEVAHQKRVAELMARTPDPDRFEIEEIEQVGSHLVLKVKYPSCTKCSFDGSKVMVIENATIKDAIKWKRIDPHFREPKKDVREAPSPSARFPGTALGWATALSWARWTQEQRPRGGPGAAP